MIRPPMAEEVYINVLLRKEQRGQCNGFNLQQTKTDTNLPNHEGLKQSIRLELISDWSIYLTVLHMFGRLKTNEKLHDIVRYYLFILFSGENISNNDIISIICILLH
jgi:hypothetical protein